MSPKKKISVFIAPVMTIKGNDQDVQQPGPSLETQTHIRRRFSQDDDIEPVKEDTTAHDLDFVDTLSTGAFADLVLVRRRDTNRVVVAKAFNHGCWRSAYLCSAELRVLQTVNSPWTVAFLGYIQVSSSWATSELGLKLNRFPRHEDS